MTREEAIKYLEQHAFIDDVVKDMCIEALGNDTNVGSKWIPCSERLPKEREGEFYPTMYVTTEYGNVQLGFYRVDDKQWYILGDEIDDEPIIVADNYVIAWQDEPKPYQQ